MRIWVCFLLCGLTISGCARKNASVPQVAGGSSGPGGSSAELTGDKRGLSPQAGVMGKVAAINPAGRYVVLSFAINRYPRLEERLSIYRQGLKVGEVKVSGPQMDENFVADIMSGEAAVGDEVLAR